MTNLTCSLENKKKSATVESDPLENIPLIDERGVESLSEQVNHSYGFYEFSRLIDFRSVKNTLPNLRLPGT